MPGIRNADRVVLLAIALCIPTIIAAFNGGLTITSALGRFVVAIVLCWAGGAIIERLFDNYSRQAREAELVQRLQRLAEARLRSTDNDLGQRQ